MKPNKKNKKRIHSSTTSDLDSSALDNTLPQESPIKKRERKKKKNNNQKTLEEFLNSEQNTEISEPNTMEQKLEAIQKQLNKVLTKEDHSFIKDIIKTTIIEMKEKILGSVLQRVEILESEVHVKSVESEKYQSALEKAKTENEKLKEENKRLHEKIKTEENNREKEVNDLEQYGRRNNIRISGITRDTDKQQSAEVTSLVIKTLKEKINLQLEERDIDIAHRLGKWESGKNRPVIVRFVRRQTKVDVMKKSKMLRSNNIYINEDLTWLNQQVLSSLRLKDRDNVEKCWSFEGKLFAIFKNNTRPTEIKYNDYCYWLNKPWPARRG